jgi:adenylate cyclase
MTGAEVHANIVETLLSGQFPRVIPSWLRLLYLAGLLALATGIFSFFSPWKALGVGVALAVVTMVFSFLLFRHDWILPVINVQLALSLSYLGILGFRLTGEERQRTYLQKLFGRYVSEEVVEKLLSTGRIPDLGGEELPVAVLFSDIRNFTTISEQLRPAEVVEMLNVYLSRACEPILEQGGTIDKFIGDAIMAVFGSPVPYPDHARRACRAALALTKIAADFRAWMETRFPDRHLPEFKIGVGIHSGAAVIGNIGSPRRTEFTAIGDTVNAASRLEGQSKTLGWTIVVSADTVRAAGSEVVTGRQAEVQVKGRTEPLEVFELVDFN